VSGIHKLSRNLRHLRPKSIIPFLRLKTAMLTAGKHSSGHYLYKFDDRSGLQGQLPPSSGIRRIDAASLVEAGLFGGWANPPSVAEAIRNEMERGASLWLFELDGNCEVHLLSIPAATVGRWYISLSGDAAILYSVNAHERVRGKGYTPGFVREVSRRLGASGDVYLDCKVWNLSAHRSFEKAGYRRIDDTIYPALT